MADLVRISKINDDPEIPFRASTAYKWAHEGKFPELFVKIGGARFVDKDALKSLIEKGRAR